MKICRNPKISGNENSRDDEKIITKEGIVSNKYIPIKLINEASKLIGKKAIAIISLI